MSNNIEVTQELELGERIPGSSYYRCFCRDCGDPMRATLDKVEDALWCEQCSPKHVGVGGHSFLASNMDNDYDAYTPSWKAGN